MGRKLKNIDLTIEQRKEIALLLERYLPDTEVWAYGSRVTFTSKSSSDLDLAVFSKPEQKTAIPQLKDAFDESDLPFCVDLKQANAFDTDYAKKFDLVFSYHKTIENVGIILEGKRYILSSNVMKLTCDKKKVNPKLMFYFFKNYLEKQGPALKASLADRLETEGLPFTFLKQIEFDLPPLKEQNRIEEMLTALDGKIELIRRMNETLKGMSQALFKSWFIDFDPVVDNALKAGNSIPEPFEKRARQRRANDTRTSLPENIRSLFPDEFRLSDELGWIPEEWEVKTVENLVRENVIDTPIPGNQPRGRYFREEGIPYITTGNISDDRINFSNCQKISEKYSDTLCTGKSIAGDILITHRTTVGQVVVVPKLKSRYIIPSPHLTRYRIRNKSKLNHIFLKGYFEGPLLQNLFNRWAGTDSVSAYLDITRQLQLPVLIPNPKIQSLFADTGYFEKKQINDSKRSNLIKLKDMLLPKLLSGSVRIPETETPDDNTQQSKGHDDNYNQ